MNEQQSDVQYMANLIDSQANRIREQQEHIDALLKLVEAYRDYDNYPDDHRECTTHSTKLNNCSLCEAEETYEQTIKR